MYNNRRGQVLSFVKKTVGVMVNKNICFCELGPFLLSQLASLDSHTPFPQSENCWELINVSLLWTKVSVPVIYDTW